MWCFILAMSGLLGGVVAALANYDDIAKYYPFLSVSLCVFIGGVAGGLSAIAMSEHCSKRG